MREGLCAHPFQTQPTQNTLEGDKKGRGETPDHQRADHAVAVPQRPGAAKPHHGVPRLGRQRLRVLHAVHLDAAPHHRPLPVQPWVWLLSYLSHLSQPGFFF